MARFSKPPSYHYGKRAIHGVSPEIIVLKGAAINRAMPLFTRAVKRSETTRVKHSLVAQVAQVAPKKPIKPIKLFFEQNSISGFHA